MCGLIGFISKNSNGITIEDKKLISQLMYISIFRGSDGSGLFVVDNHGDLISVKGGMPSYFFVNTKEFQDQMDNAYKNGKFIIGHVRAATNGAVCDENSHPFVFDKFAMVHNGVIRNHAVFDKTEEVDSACFAKYMSSIENKDYKEAFAKISGAFAIIGYDATSKELVVAKNTERPLHYVELPSGWLIASEESMLEFLLKRTNVKKIDVNMVVSNRLYRIPIDVKKNLFDNYEEIPLKPETTYNSSWHSSWGWDEDYSSSSNCKRKLRFDVNEKINCMFDTRDNGSTVCTYEGTAELDPSATIKLVIRHSDKTDYMEGKWECEVTSSAESNKSRIYWVKVIKKVKNNEQLPLLLVDAEGSSIRKSEWQHYNKSCIHCGTTVEEAGVKDSLFLSGNRVLCPSCYLTTSGHAC